MKEQNEQPFAAPVDRNAQLIALTFDDGPNTEITPQVLDILEENGASASFFLIADNITSASEQVVRRAFDMGCGIENHSLTHGFMNRMSPETIRAEVSACTERIVRITGTKPRFFRPPYIAVSRTMFEEIGLTFICGVGCEDWVPEVSAAERAKRVLSAAKHGDIILLHDMRGNVGTVEALRVIIPALKSRGFRFVSCGQLFDELHVTPVHGRLYSNVFQTADMPS